MSADQLTLTGRGTQQEPLAAGCQSARHARHALRNVMARRGWSLEDIETGCLAVSEVLTNALTHSDGLVELIIEASDDHVRVEVTDHSDAPPVLRSPSRITEGGRGVMILDAIVHRWGLERIEGTTGKRVWFELHRTSTPSHDHAHPAELPGPPSIPSVSP